MKRTFPTGASGQFKGNVRHCHRISYPLRSWEEWVDGKGAGQLNWKNHLKLVGVVVGILALIGIFVALIIELS